MKTAIRKIFNKPCTLMNKDYNDYIIRKPNEFIKEIAELFASQNPERIREVLQEILSEHKSTEGNYKVIYWDEVSDIINSVISDLCSGSQEEEDEIICRDGYIIFPKNNNIPYGQDFNFWQNIPSKIKFYPAFFGNERIKFIGDGYGILNDNIYKLIGKYGNGAIFVSVKDLPENVKEYCMNNLLNSL